MTRIIGSSVERVEDRALLRGQACFVDDIAFPGMLHAAFVRSAQAHALIRGIDISAALEVPGVRAIWRMEDIVHHLNDPLLKVALPSPAFRQELHRPTLSDKEVVHVGEAIAVVIADSRYVAEDAAALVMVDYEPLPVVNDCQAALAPDAPRAHSNQPHNLVAEFTMGYGDHAKAFADAPHVFREELWQHRGVAHSMECRGVVAQYDKLEDRTTVWSSTQTPHACKRVICEVLGLDEDKLRVVTPDVGGGFGPKLVFYPEEVILALATRELRAPVKWIEDRREHFVATTQERDQLWDMEIAVDGEGKILGLRGLLIHDHGAYTARGVNVPYGSAAAITLPYVIPAFFLDIKLAVTNKVPVTPIRGAGQPQAVFAMERLLDRVARELKIAPEEVRRRNLVPPEKIPYTTPLKTRGGMQVVLDSGDYPATQAAALAKADWAGFRARQAQARKEGRYLGIGMANYVEGTGRGPFEPVSVRIGENGRIHVASGAAAMGQSTKTMLAQVVAEQLGCDMNNVSVVTGDTAAIDYGMGGFNSRQAVMAGASAHAAAQKVRAKALTVAAHMLDVGEQALEIEGRHVRLKGSDDKKVGLGEIARALAGLPGYYVPGGLDPGLEATERVIINDMTYANGTAVVEVEVDPETGLVKLEHVTFAHDCGNVLHPQIVEGQIIGGMAHGIGNALYEWMGYDENAQPVTTTLAEYLLVSATEMPVKTDIVHLTSPTPLNELGIKGVGESGVIPMTAAVAAAVDDALAPFHVKITRVPITPPDLVSLIEKANP
jgi:aerobic carbon-monoxide dehydrogenase large subunit